MFISGTMYVLFSFICLIVNQFSKDLYYNENNPLIILLSVVSLLLGFFCYYKSYNRR